MELRRFRELFAILVGALIGVALLNLIASITTSSDMNNSNDNGIAIFLVLITPFVLYNFVYHPTKSFTYAMLPVSWLEKFMSAWVMCVIFAPLLLFGFSFLTTFLIDLGIGQINNRVAFNPKSFLTNVYLPTIATQSIAFWGAFWFKRQKVGKTILTIVIVVTTLVVSALIVVKQLPEDTFYGEFSWQMDTAIFAYLFMILLWTLALLKFPRTQI